MAESQWQHIIGDQLSAAAKREFRKSRMLAQFQNKHLTETFLCCLRVSLSFFLGPNTTYFKTGLKGRVELHKNILEVLGLQSAAQRHFSKANVCQHGLTSCHPIEDQLLTQLQYII